MIYFIVLVVVVAAALKGGLKRHTLERRVSGWRVWSASALALGIGWLVLNAESLGVPLSFLSPMVEDHLGLLTLSLCCLAAFFGVQLIVNHIILRDANGGTLETTVNTRLCVRAILALLSIPVALVLLHVFALGLIFVA